MAESEEASWLRQNWGERLFQYNKRWIAVKGNEVIASSPSHDGLIADVESNQLRTFADINPLIAFVFLDELQ